MWLQKFFGIFESLYTWNYRRDAAVAACIALYEYHWIHLSPAVSYPLYMYVWISLLFVSLRYFGFNNDKDMLLAAKASGRNWPDSWSDETQPSDGGWQGVTCNSWGIVTAMCVRVVPQGKYSSSAHVRTLECVRTASRHAAFGRLARRGHHAQRIRHARQLVHAQHVVTHVAGGVDGDIVQPTRKRRGFF